MGTRSRTCTNPAPEFGGADCVGDDAETEPCTVTCKNAYTYGSDVLVRGCPAPKCDSATTIVNDAWQRKVGKKFRYGFALTINVPEEYWGSKGWSVLLRFNGANNGNFQLWNANFFNFFRKESGMEVLIHQKYWTKNDLHDEHSFMIIAERLDSSEVPEVYFGLTVKNVTTASTRTCTLATEMAQLTSTAQSNSRTVFKPTKTSVISKSLNLGKSELADKNFIVTKYNLMLKTKSIK